MFGALGLAMVVLSCIRRVFQRGLDSSLKVVYVLSWATGCRGGSGYDYRFWTLPSPLIFASLRLLD